MKHGKNWSFIMGIMVIVVTGIVCGAVIQSHGKEAVKSEQQQPSPDAKDLWSQITKTEQHYRSWKHYPEKGKEGLYPAIERGPTPAKNPHGGYMKLFVNDITEKAAHKTEGGPDMPNGAVLVMENYRRDKETLYSVTVMYKVDGFAPEQGNWFWASYDPEGKVMEAGKVQGCIDCHRVRKDNDWRFAGSRGKSHGHGAHK
jgi:hypothetical protein